MNDKSEESFHQHNRLREFNIEKYSIRHVALKLCYLGWNYGGFVTQNDVKKTVEDALFSALLKTKLIVDRESSHYTRCGRTDKGVSSVGQVIALHLRSKCLSGVGIVRTPIISEEVSSNTLQSESLSPLSPVSISSNSRNEQEIDYVRTLNSVLPSDIRVLSYAPVPLCFDARFSTVSRTYKYFFIRKELDIERMQQASQRFIGEHDFRNFCKIDVSNVENFVRRIHSFDIGPVAQSQRFRV